MKRITKLVTLALGLFTSFSAIGLSCANKIDKSAKAELEHDPIYYTDSVYWNGGCNIQDSSVDTFDASRDGTSCKLSWSAEPTNYYNPGVEITSKESFINFQAIYVTFAIPVEVKALSVASYEYTWDFKLKRTASETGTKPDFSGELFYYGVLEKPEDRPSIPNTFFHSNGNYTETTGKSYSLFRTASNSSNKLVSKSCTHTVNVKNSTNEDTTKYVYFAYFTYIDAGSRTDSFSSLCAISKITSSSTDIVCSCGGEYYTNLIDAEEKFNSSNGNTIKLLADISFSGYGLQLTKSGTIDLNGYRVIRSGNLANPLFTLKSSSSVNLISSVEGGYIDISSGNSVFDLTGSSSLTIDGNLTVRNTSSVSNSVCIAVTKGNFKLVNGYVIGNRCGIVAQEGNVEIAGGKVSSYYNVAINANKTNDSTVNIYIYGTDAVVDGEIQIGDLSKHNLYLSNSTGSIYYDPTDSSSVISIIDIVNPVEDQIVIHNSDKADVEIELVEVLGFDITASGKNTILKEHIYTVEARGADIFTLSGDLQFTYMQEGGITFNVALKEVGELRRVDVYCDVLTQLVEDVDYEYSTETGDVMVYSESLKGDLTVRIYRIAEHVITFVANGATGSVDPISYKTGETVTIPDPAAYLTYKYHRFQEWNTKADGTGITVMANSTHDDYDEDKVLYAIWTQETEDVCNEFQAVYLYIQASGDTIDNPIDINNIDYTGACAGENGLYAIAKAAFVLLSDTAKGRLMSESGLSHFQAARARLIAWAAANGETWDASTLSFVSMSNRTSQVVNSDVTLIIVVIAISSSMLLAYVALRKKKHN